MFTSNLRVVCADGFSMSVQANATVYCSPRTNNAAKYEEVEVGMPSDKEPLLMAYCEEPAQVIINVVAKHGGMIEGELPAGIPVLRASSR